MNGVIGAHAELLWRNTEMTEVMKPYQRKKDPSNAWASRVSPRAGEVEHTATRAPAGTRSSDVRICVPPPRKPQERPARRGSLFV